MQVAFCFLVSSVVPALQFGSLGLDLYNYFTLLLPFLANPIMRISDDFLNSALTPLFYLVEATVTKSSSNQLSCISI